MRSLAVTLMTGARSGIFRSAYLPGIHAPDHPPRAGRPSPGDVRMSQIVSSVQAEYLRYKGLAEAAIAQLSDADLVVPGPGDGNSIAVLCWHLAGNFRS